MAGFVSLLAVFTAGVGNWRLLLSSKIAKVCRKSEAEKDSESKFFKN